MSKPRDGRSRAAAESGRPVGAVAIACDRNEDRPFKLLGPARHSPRYDVPSLGPGPDRPRFYGIRGLSSRWTARQTRRDAAG